ncbi:alpha/beta hydrolase [Dyadobacter psychrophilus]|uniref:Alpha/beta hydrolase n=1 Tax=Dyadobacter psychrophilus TaxID=651661 RepID=A0A1T5D9T2_9BACT|nr:alpha/beta hydrolase [Dyadobacter psychrophilus]SKB68361.1 Alpha/beta hydrolase of unknown function [Dyadobacter psychrophilus]
MKGIVNQHLNERQLKPSVNANISHFYRKGDVLEIAGATLGDPFDDDNLWYSLANGGFVWNGAVDIEPQCITPDPGDKEQYIISYREILDNGKPNMFTKEPPDKLYFTPLLLPGHEESIRFNQLDPENAADAIIKSVRKLADKRRRHVVLYIHGFQPFSSLKLDLLSSFANNYMNHPGNKVAKVLFMVWPAQGLSRKRADDRAIEAGRHFTDKNLFEPLKIISKQLSDAGLFLDLIVHSFGHQLLNGMLNPPVPNNIPEQIFENIFLMASDVTHLALSEGGKELDNFFGKSSTFTYDYTLLKRLGKNINVFYDEFDYLLYSSTKRFVGAKRIANAPDPQQLTASYRNLGNYGTSEFKEGFIPQDGFHIQSVQELIKPGDLINLCDFPWQQYDKESFFRKHINQAVSTANYAGFGLLDIIFNQRRLQNYHKYVFTCKPVVNEVLSRMT